MYSRLPVLYFIVYNVYYTSISPFQLRVLFSATIIDVLRLPTFTIQ
jgi:hypothetical protein